MFVDALDFGTLGIQIEPDKVGCPQYASKAMLKLLVYGYSYGVRSSRKLERETHYNLSFIWPQIKNWVRLINPISNTTAKATVIFVRQGRF